ncbi:unnamed protein product [Ilex paraguariensis]|uniref:Myb/SANT-like domain-containing protein n=1 Tax=Ilex paraguariensis TaxID=185542 RepID=A0ABC8SCT6_9AQUA
MFVELFQDLNSGQQAAKYLYGTHRDARVYRRKAVENYTHLCTIFGNCLANGFITRTADDTVHSLAAELGVEAIDASPTECQDSMKDQAKNMRWTNEMDRCLSKILVKQIKLGNKSKSENKFKTAAYVAAVSALNKRFQLDFTKDHVKNRIKTWKKFYGSVKGLLEQGDFRWDETRKMVTADASVWHSYIKKNPNVRLLQGRVIENYDDLCVVIGNDDPILSSGNDTETDLYCDADNSVEAELAYQNQSDCAKEKGKCSLWTHEMDLCLTEKLIEQVKLGNKLERNFRPVAYAAALNALNENFALDLTMDEIRRRVKTWKKLYGTIKELLSNRGFTWDERQNMVVANDTTWNEYIKVHFVY